MSKPWYVLVHKRDGKAVWVQLPDRVRAASMATALRFRADVAKVTLLPTQPTIGERVGRDA